MSNELIKYAFTAGELSPTLLGRSDLEQYDLGLALAHNWIVDYRGGLSTRPGLEFCEFVMRDDLDTTYFDFSFNPDIANVYLILFGHNYVRFLQDGSYVLEAAKTITAVSSDGIVTSAAHGFAVGDWVKLADVGGITNINDRTYQISATTTNTFTIKIVPDISNFVAVGTYTSGGSVARIYTLATPYASTDLADLHAFQRRDTLRLTNKNFPIYNLKRMDQTNWTLTTETIGNNVARPAGPICTPSGSGAAGTVVTVTAVFEDETESLMADPTVVSGMVNYSATAGSLTIDWSLVPGAVSYKVYRSIIGADGTKMHTGYQLGYIGTVQGTRFIDSNIIPDFTKTPPVGDNPFAPGQIDLITVNTGGTGYPNGAVITMSGGGTGFIGVPVIVGSSIVAIRIIARGKNYVNPTISVSVGSGFTATVTANSITGQNPSISTIFQQRQMYAASINNPLTLWASHPGLPSNFDFSDITIDSDAYEFEIDSAEVSPIRHMIPMRGGLVIFSQTGIWQLSGGSDGVVTPTNALADPQNYSGSSEVMPIKVGSDLLYIEGKGFTVRLLSYNEFAKVYGGEDKSLLSNHLFNFGKRITRWAFAENPFKIVYAVRSDGALLSFTIVKDEKVFAWTWNTTKGKILDCRVVFEDDIDRLYVMVQRNINGRLTKFIERLVDREFEFSENSFCVDCGLSLPGTYPSATVRASSTSGTITLTTDVNTFSPGDVGKVVRAGGGKITITAYTDATHVTGFVNRDITDVAFQDPDNTPNPQVAGTWTMDMPQTVISGLWHLEGQTVSILADGNVMPEATVVDGAITLENAASRAIIGLPFTCIAKTLSPVVTDAIIEARRKRIVGVAARVNDTRGLKTGRALDSLYESRERTNESYGEPIELFSGIRVQMIDPEWNDEGQTYFVQDQPLPATLLGLVVDIEVGDDPG